MRAGRWAAAAVAAVTVVFSVFGIAEARIAPGAEHAVLATPPALLERRDLKRVRSSTTHFISPRISGRLVRNVAAPARHRQLAVAVLRSPAYRLPSVVELAGAPAHVPARFNATPDHRLQSAKTLMPEVRPHLFARDGLPRQTGCMALAIYYEARSEDALGQIAVAQVILNRVQSRKYPNSICRVVFQNAHWRNRCQFSFACDGRVEDPRHVRAWRSAVQLAQRLKCGNSCRAIPRRLNPLNRLPEVLRRATHYHADYVSPRWARKLLRAEQVGRHIFYISRRVWS